MIDRSYFGKIRKSYAAYEDARRSLIKQAGDALSMAKQAIFALHRGDRAAAEKLLVTVREEHRSLAKAFRKIPALVGEGSYRAALEEYVEAELFRRYVAGETLAEVEAPGIDEDIYLAGLLDCTGEIVRHAILAATHREFAEVDRAYDTVAAVVGELMKMNITGPLRPKYDQAKTSLRKLEEIRYDISLRKT